LLIGVSALAWLTGAQPAAPSVRPMLSVDNAVATAGYYRLSWRLAGAAGKPTPDFELQESTDPHFYPAVTLYRGPDLATVLSGRRNGLRYYRVRVIPGTGAAASWSDILPVETRHHSMARALTFFSLGALVFVLTLFLILRPRAQDITGHQPPGGK